MFDIYTPGYFRFTSPNNQGNTVSEAFRYGRDFESSFVDVGLNPFLFSRTFCAYVMQMTIRILFGNTFGEIARGNKFKVENKKFKLDTKRVPDRISKTRKKKLAMLAHESLILWLNTCR